MKLLTVEYDVGEWKSVGKQISIQEAWMEKQCVYDSWSKESLGKYLFQIKIKSNEIDAYKNLQGRGPAVIGLIRAEFVKNRPLHFRPINSNRLTLRLAEQPMSDTLWLYLVSGYETTASIEDSLRLIRKFN